MVTEQVAEVMAWLLGGRTARPTGQGISVDGGFTTARPFLKQLAATTGSSE